jgi:hypothetical protein
LAYLKYAPVSKETQCRGKRDRQKRHTKFKRFLLSQVYLAAREEAGHAHQSTNLYMYIYIYIYVYIYIHIIYIYIYYSTLGRSSVHKPIYIYVCIYITEARETLKREQEMKRDAETQTDKKNRWSRDAETQTDN